MKFVTSMFAVALLAAGSTALGQPMFDTGRQQVKGIQLLQDYADHNAYYYVPTHPRVATDNEGNLQFLCVKYVDDKGDASGGLFHALVEFSLPDETVQALEKELKKSAPGARIVGPVPLFAAKKESEDQPGSFEIVSATLSDRGGKDHMTRSVVTSGTAPLTPGSRAAVAALLNQQGATLLWNSLGAPTSDVSVAVNAYYEAIVSGFSAHVVADVSTVYKHYSNIFNRQQDYTRRQIRDVSDELIRNGSLKIESLDRGTALGIKTEDMARLLDLVTQKLTELMFDAKTGFSTDPEREPAVEANQLPGRLERSWLSKTFGGTDDTKYYTDDQWVLKERKDIRQNIFSITLTKNGSIKVPLNTAGNIGGLYRGLKDDPRYFRIVNLADAAFEKNVVSFQVDGEYIDSFTDTVNYVAVNLRKRYADPSHETATATLRVDAAVLKTGDTVKTLSFPRLGEAGPDVRQYEYQIVWSVRDRQPIRLPPVEGEWIHTSDPVVALVPPFEKVQIDVDADRTNFKSRNVQACVIELKYPLVGKPVQNRKATLRSSDAESSNHVTFYRDRTGSKTQIRTTWYFKDGTTIPGAWKELTDTYMNLVPPGAPPDTSPATTNTPAVTGTGQ